MGDIKDGSISGVLPSSNEVFAVHYPGYPSSTERAVDTLGGKDVVVKVRSDKSSKLKLHFRPEDPYSHPAFGELLPCNSYLLKLSKRKAASEVKQTNDGVKDELFADIVSRVSEAYHFNGMVDYQHVFAVHADITRRKKRKLTGIEPQLEDIGLLDVNKDDLMILVPPLFSKKGPPEEVVLKTFGDSSLKKKQEEAVHRRSGMEIEQCLAIDFNIKEIPKKVNWEDSIPRNSDQWQLQRVVCQLFDERPIWSKLSLAEHLLDRGIRVVNKVLRRILFIAAYYFSNGPYLRFWIRKGYDPRKDPESRIYQRTDFRVPPSLRSYCDTNQLSGLMCRWQDICAFRVFPRKCQLSLQLVELKDDFIQQEIGKPASQENCSLQTGWFSAHVIETLRLRVAQRFLSIYPETGAESLLKTVSKNFEKSSRPQLNKTDKKVDGEGKQADKDISEIEDKEANDEGEYEEDEEDEMEDYNLEEEMDVDEELDPVNQNGSFSYMDQENMSKDYLQELFGSFPFEIPDDDGGYQIYDQYSDDNFSDDEDF